MFGKIFSCIDSCLPKMVITNNGRQVGFIQVPGTSNCCNRVDLFCYKGTEKRPDNLLFVISQSSCQICTCFDCLPCFEKKDYYHNCFPIEGKFIRRCCPILTGEFQQTPSACANIGNGICWDHCYDGFEKPDNV